LPDRNLLRSLIDAEGRMPIRVTPGADRDALSIEGRLLKARVRAVPEAGAANAAVTALVARALGNPKSAVSLLRGHGAREKLLRIAQE
jgi:uncharacterized protein YggU (UPF0235/DUF167 family)